MSAYVAIYNNVDNTMFDCTRAVSNLQVYDYIENDPGKATFNIRKSDSLVFFEGATVMVWYDKADTTGFFYGYVFTKKRNKDLDLISVTCYDSRRYLKNKDSYVTDGMTSDQIFSKLCNDFAIKHKVVDASSHICTARSHDDQSLYDIIKYGLDDTLINAHKWYFIRDNFGTLEHINVMSCNSGVMLGDKSGIIDLDYETSIDKDVYNQVKLYKDNKTTGKRELYIVNDTINGGKTLKAWGLLQFTEKLKENLTFSQIENRALAYLKYYNSVKRKLKLTSLGVPTVRAGSIFRCKIQALGDISVDSYLLVTESVHKFYDSYTEMELTTEVIDNEW